MNRKSLKIYFILFFVCASFFISIGYSQKQYVMEPIIEAKFSQDSIMIGDQIVLRVTVDKDIMQATQFPKFENGLGDVIEILQESEVDTLKKDGRRITIRKDYLVTSFDAGYYNIGLFPILNKEKNIIDTIFSRDSILLFVDTFLIDTTKQSIIDITDPLEAPLQFEEIQNHIIIGLLALILLALIIYFVRKYFKRMAARMAQVPLLPPHIEAMNELEKLYPLQLWKAGRHKLYYTKLSDIVRIYIERRYEVAAMEMTTDEIFSALKNIDVPSDSQFMLKEFLTLCDFVKFAKMEPDEDEHEKSFKSAYAFVMDTKPEITTQQKNEIDDMAKKSGI